MTSVSMDLMDRIRQVADTLGSGGRAVADLVISRPEEVALLPAAKVADQLGISQSTVIRFATALGYDGYPELRRALQDQLRSTLSPTKRLGKSLPNSAGSGWQKSFQEDATNIASTEAEPSMVNIPRSADMILAARRVYIVGLRASYGVAVTLQYYLDQVIESVTLVEPARGQDLDQLIGIGKEDLLIAISFPRYTKLSVVALEIARDQGAATIAITDGPLSPLARLSDIVLRAHCLSENFGNSLTAAIAIVNAILRELAIKNPDAALKSLSRMEALLRRTDSLVFGDE